MAMIASPPSSTALSSSCSICIHGGESLKLIERNITIPGYENVIQNCNDVAALAASLSNTSSQCRAIQAIGTLCGCPKKKDNACNLCSNDKKMEYGWRELPFLAHYFGDMVPTCEIMDAVLHLQSNQSKLCIASHYFMEDYCGCDAQPGSMPQLSNQTSDQCHLCASTGGKHNSSFQPDKQIEIEGFPFQTCHQLSEAATSLLSSESESQWSRCRMLQSLGVYCGCDPPSNEIPCQICPVDNSYTVPWPEKLIGNDIENVVEGFSFSCGVMSEIAKAFPSTSSTDAFGVAFCRSIQGLGTDCGCSKPPEPSCSVCPHPLTSEYIDLKPLKVEPYTKVTCGQLQNIAPFLRDGDIFPVGFDGSYIKWDCRFYRMVVGLFCGCDDGVFTYWGANTLKKQAVAVWTQRAIAILSFLGASAIVLHILTSKVLRTQVYYRIMLGISISDIFSSLAWGLGPIMTVADFHDFVGLDMLLTSTEKKDLSFYESYGNHASCTAQGFFLHLGFTSILYNAALSYVYKLTVVNSFREVNFSLGYKTLLLAFPGILGLIVAFAAIPFVTFTPMACTIGTYRDVGGWPKLIGLFYAPYGPAFLFIPLNTMFVYWRVRQQCKERENVANVIKKDSSILSPTDKRDELPEIEHPLTVFSHLERRVFWQSFWYMASFFASYTIFLVVFAMDGYDTNSYPLYMVMSILTPMQGFFNSIVYFRERFWKRVTGRNTRPAVVGTKWSWDCIKNSLVKLFSLNWRTDINRHRKEDNDDARVHLESYFLFLLGSGVEPLLDLNQARAKVEPSGGGNLIDSISISRERVIHNLHSEGNDVDNSAETIVTSKAGLHMVVETPDSGHGRDTYDMKEALGKEGMEDSFITDNIATTFETSDCTSMLLVEENVRMLAGSEIIPFQARKFSRRTEASDGSWSREDGN